jgi:hypothetical protein
MFSSTQIKRMQNQSKNKLNLSNKKVRNLKLRLKSIWKSLKKNILCWKIQY